MNHILTGVLSGICGFSVFGFLFWIFAMCRMSALADEAAKKMGGKL